MTSCFCQNTIEKRSHILDDAKVASLLLKPECLNTYIDTVKDYTVEILSIPSNGIYLYAELYIPSGGNSNYPLVILTHGGFNEFDIIMASPLYHAPRFAHCGIAACIYHKRGTGKSGGDYANSTNDDFINDIGAIAIYLSKHKNIDSTRISVDGGSAGGLNAPVAAARFPIISFVISKSGPIVKNEEELNYNMENALKFRGYSHSIVKEVMPYWEKHHALWAKKDTVALKIFAKEIIELRKKYDMFALPSTYDEVLTDTNLIFLRPTFNSMSNDVYREIKNLKANCLFIYGENDKIVPVQASVGNIQKLMGESNNENYDIIILKGTDHSFFDQNGEQKPVIRIILNWLNEEKIFK